MKVANSRGEDLNHKGGWGVFSVMIRGDKILFLFFHNCFLCPLSSAAQPKGQGKVLFLLLTIYCTFDLFPIVRLWA